MINSKYETPSGKISLVRGSCIPLIGDDIDTDRIIPARYLKCITFDSLGESVFKDDRETLNGKHPFDLESHKGASILLVNKNFGCGSSREHAPQALMRWGIRAIIGESFADIFYGNCIAIGIPCFTLKGVLLKKLQKKALVNNLNMEIDVIESIAKTNKFNYDLEIKESTKKMLISGNWDTTATLLKNSELVEKTIKNITYLKFN